MSIRAGSQVNGPPWSRDQQAASLPIPMGTAMVCWGPVVEGGVSRLTRRKKGRQEEARIEGRKATTTWHKHCGKACPCEWGSLAVDVCAGCQRRDCNMRNGKEKEYDGVMEKNLCKRQEKQEKKRVLCGGKWE